MNRGEDLRWVGSRCPLTHALEEKVEENTKSLASTEEKMAKMEAMLEDHANRLRRNNVVIYCVPEGAEGEDCIVFVKKTFCGSYGYARSGGLGDRTCA